MKSKVIVHVSEVDITPKSGMGRIEYYWEKSFASVGYDFIHIGPKETGSLRHKAFFPYKALSIFKKMRIQPTALILHEPASGPFSRSSIPSFVESHGIERRNWEAVLNGKTPGNLPSLKTRLFYPLWRLSACDSGLKSCTKLLLSNNDDKEYAQIKYQRKAEDIFVFKNGITNYSLPERKLQDFFTVLFNASWIERKGIGVLVKAARMLYEKGLPIQYLLIGTGKDTETVLLDWPLELRAFLKIVPHFSQEDEIGYLNSASLFILPSYFEGQPLSLLQAMAAGKCCITTNCCGQKDLIINGETGILFNTGDHTELASEIQDCYMNPHKVERIGENAIRFSKNLTWDNVSGEVVNYILQHSQ